MISYDEALKIIQSLQLEGTRVLLPLADCTGSLLAENIEAKVPSPVFTNSAMDGFALKQQDIGVKLKVDATFFAGKIEQNKIPDYQAGTCVRIMTGALVPEWADTVVPVENTTTDQNGSITIVEPSALGANIRTQGEDIRVGDRLLTVGMRLTPERIMVAAAMGASQANVFAKPKIFFISTGDELCEPGTALEPGQIYNSSKFFLRAAAQAAGIPDALHLTVSDDKAVAGGQIRVLLDLAGPKIIISTGAVSAGVADFIPELAQELGFAALFHKVAIRPGKPVYLAKRPDAVWLGLPGNPISTNAGWYFFAIPLLHSLVGVRAQHLYNFKLNNDVRKPEHLRCFFRAEVRDHRAWVPQSQGSGHFASSINQDAFVVLPEGISLVKAETIVPGIFIS